MKLSYATLTTTIHAAAQNWGLARVSVLTAGLARVIVLTAGLARVSVSTPVKNYAPPMTMTKKMKGGEWVSKTL